MTDLRTAAQQALEALEASGGCLAFKNIMCRCSELCRSYTAAQHLRAALAQQAEPVEQTCNCRWDGDVQVQQCTLHEAHVDAIHEWAERAKVAERKLAQQAEPDHETRAELAEQQVVQLAEERDHYRNLWQKAQQAEPQNTHSTECWRWHHKCAVAKIERECKHD